MCGPFASKTSLMKSEKDKPKDWFYLEVTFIEPMPRLPSGLPAAAGFSWARSSLVTGTQGREGATGGVCVSVGPLTTTWCWGGGQQEEHGHGLQVWFSARVTCSP